MTRMRTGVVPALASTALACALACTRSGDDAPERNATARESERLQQIVERLQAEHGIPGLSVAIAESGKEPLVATAGVADLERGTPVTAETMFFIGSISKNLFATVVLRLVDQGRLRLESPLSKYVEWPRGDEITIKMLLNHTSGIRDYLTRDRFSPAGDGGIPKFFRTSWTPIELFATIPNRTPLFDPGSKQQYSNTNGLLVGEVIRQVTGRSLGTAFDELLVRPLGLRQTYLYGEGTADRDRARGYSGAEDWGAVDGRLVDCSSADEALPDSADGSVVTSARDLLRYHQALRRGELLGDDSWAAMRTVEPGLHNGLAYLVGEGKFGRYEGNVGRAMGHVAANVYYRDRDTYLVMMSNRNDVPLPIASLLEQWSADVIPAPLGD